MERSKFVFLAVFALVFFVPMTLRAQSQPKEYLTARDRLRVGDTRIALKNARDSIRNHPRHLPSLSLVLRLYRNKGELETGLAFIKTHFERIRSGELFARFISLSGLDRASRIRLFQWAEDTKIFHSDIYEDYGRLLVEQHEWERANTLLKRGLSKYPANTTLLLLRSKALMVIGNCESARAHLDRVEKLRPGWTEVYRWKAFIARKLGLEAMKRIARKRYFALTQNSVEADQFPRFKCD